MQQKIGEMLFPLFFVKYNYLISIFLTLKNRKARNLLGLAGWARQGAAPPYFWSTITFTEEGWAAEW